MLPYKKYYLLHFRMNVEIATIFLVLPIEISICQMLVKSTIHVYEIVLMAETNVDVARALW